jgi:hypothetical protein
VFVVIGKPFPVWSNKHSSLVRKSVNHGQTSFITLAPGAIVIKLSTIVSYNFSKYARAFTSGKPFQPSLLFNGKAEAYPIEAPLWVRLLALPTNKRLGWKGLPVINTLDYCENS